MAMERKIAATRTDLMIAAPNARLALKTGEAERAAELGRVKLAAALTLAGSLALLVFAKIMPIVPKDEPPVFDGDRCFRGACVVGVLQQFGQNVPWVLDLPK